MAEDTSGSVTQPGVDSCAHSLGWLQQKGHLAALTQDNAHGWSPAVRQVIFAEAQSWDNGSNHLWGQSSLRAQAWLSAPCVPPSVLFRLRVSLMSCSFVCSHEVRTCEMWDIQASSGRFLRVCYYKNLHQLPFQSMSSHFRLLRTMCRQILNTSQGRSPVPYCGVVFIYIYSVKYLFCFMWKCDFMV